MTDAVPAPGGDPEDPRVRLLDQPSLSVAVAMAEAEVPATGVRPPDWLGEEGERSLASTRVLLDGSELVARFDELWGTYLQRCARLAVLSQRVRVLERAVELLDAVKAAQVRLRATRSLESARSQRDAYEDGPWECVTGIRATLEQHRRREVYAMAQRRWRSVGNEAEDRVTQVDNPVPEIVAAATLTGVYVAVRLVGHALGASGSSLGSTASLAAVVVALVAAARTYSRQSRARAVAVGRARSEERHARSMEAVCRRAAAGGDEPPAAALSTSERAMVARAVELGRDEPAPGPASVSILSS